MVCMYVFSFSFRHKSKSWKSAAHEKQDACPPSRKDKRELVSKMRATTTQRSPLIRHHRAIIGGHGDPHAGGELLDALDGDGPLVHLVRLSCHEGAHGPARDVVCERALGRLREQVRRLRLGGGPARRRRERRQLGGVGQASAVQVNREQRVAPEDRAVRAEQSGKGERKKKWRAHATAATRERQINYGTRRNANKDGCSGD